ncbi:MAG: Ribonuclease 3 [Alphaproteobacteria bacterium MarineAlpha5_Bin8]|nr:MAG: Ribonuclease 3 [Alphaproteobacteria bacterium MarineAlpha5_Bin8]PPR45871.1 MAG: Ribonuclease 3 [Alphaproteobacteria bacterium MarineAlpha5_Bin7]PPR52926.1 MAG: Ribonuclease 3 [Alphaproteobacteria bacterium MarineAlpha5_Bin6]|tara:strand:- start:1555 stop:2247 length:693 start_codon:yes stop_codon:yes gene_type:complete
MKLKKNIKEIEKILGYSFRKKKLLEDSLIHPSFHKNNKKKDLDNNQFERLEFLGDRVLNLSIAALIYDKFLKFDEGSLTKKLSYLVQRDFLYKIALKIKLDEILHYSSNENKKINKSILADSVESIIGAIYLDGGYKASIKFVNRIWESYLDLQESNEQDPKTKLQEISQQKFKTLPIYKLIKKTGPSHSPSFTISLKALKKKPVKASGLSIREAEKKAAKIILDLLSEK